MYNFLAKKGQLIAFLFGLTLTVIFIAMVFGGLDVFNDLPKEEKSSSDLFNFGLRAAIFMVITCGVLFLVTVATGLLTNLKGSLRMIISLVVAAVLILIFYSSAPTEFSHVALTDAIQKYDLSDGIVKLVSGGIVTAVIMTVGAFAIFVVMEIVNIFK